MGLLKCRECNGQVASSAKVCPHCGSGAFKPKPGLIAQIGGLFFLGLFALGFIGSIMKNNDQAAKSVEPAPAPALVASKTKEQLQDERKQRAIASAKDAVRSAQYACKEGVKQSLHDPDSAQFDEFTKFPVFKREDGTYAVTVGVRAKNGFNALRFMKILCVVTRESGNLRVNLENLEE